MKTKIYISLIILFFNSNFAISQVRQQQDVFDQSLNTLNQLNDALEDCMASFMEFPEMHSNTIKVHSRVSTIKTALKDQTFNSSAYHDPQALWSNPKVQEYYSQVKKMLIYATLFEELLRPIIGYNSAGLTQEQMSLLNPMCRIFGWEIALLDINCKDTYFYEYTLKGFKMMFIKNTLPPYDEKNSGLIAVDFTYDNGEGGNYNVGGGLYRMIQYKDDKNKNYRKVIKASSKRLF